MDKVSAEDRRRAHSYGAGFKARFYYAGPDDQWVVLTPEPELSTQRILRSGKRPDGVCRKTHDLAPRQFQT